MIEENLVVIIKLVGFLVLRPHPTGQLTVIGPRHTGAWNAPSNARSKREISNTRPNTSIR